MTLYLFTDSETQLDQEQVEESYLVGIVLVVDSRDAPGSSSPPQATLGDFAASTVDNNTMSTTDNEYEKTHTA